MSGTLNVGWLRLLIFNSVAPFIVPWTYWQPGGRSRSKDEPDNVNPVVFAIKRENVLSSSHMISDPGLLVGDTITCEYEIPEKKTKKLNRYAKEVYLAEYEILICSFLCNYSKL